MLCVPHYGKYVPILNPHTRVIFNSVWELCSYFFNCEENISEEETDVQGYGAIKWLGYKDKI